jgi:hypothetical protein
VEEQSTLFVSEWGVTDKVKLSIWNDRVTGVVVIKVHEAPGTESDTDKSAMLQNEENELSVIAIKVGRKPCWHWPDNKILPAEYLFTELYSL